MEVIVVEGKEWKESRLSNFPDNIEAFSYDLGDISERALLCYNDPPVKSFNNAIVFLHSGNPEKRLLVLESHPLSFEKHTGKKGTDLITYLALAVCKSGGRVVIFSGGNPKAGMEKFVEILDESQFQEGLHYEFVKIDEIKKEDQIFDESTIPNNWKINTINKAAYPISKELLFIYSLFPFDLFLQVYLFVSHPEKYILSNKLSAEHLKSNYFKINRESFTKDWRNIAKPVAEKLNIEKLLKLFDVSEANTTKQETKNITNVLNILSQEKNELNNNLDELIEQAHKEFTHLVKKKALRKLERLRSLLNHNKIKNDFLNLIGSARMDLSIEERSTDILLVWSNQSVPNSEQGPQLQAKIDTVRKGLSNWQNSFRALKDFFETKPAEFGLSMTLKGQQVKKAFFEGEKSYTAIIDRFVNSFDDLVDQTKNEQLKKLENFWAAADKIHETLSKMTLKMNSDEFFDSCFEFKE